MVNYWLPLLEFRSPYTRLTVLLKEIEKRYLLSNRKTPIKSTEVMQIGKQFHIRAVVNGKARSPMADSRVQPTISDEDEAKCSL